MTPVGMDKPFTECIYIKKQVLINGTENRNLCPAVRIKMQGGKATTWLSRLKIEGTCN